MQRVLTIVTFVVLAGALSCGAPQQTPALESDAGADAQVIGPHDKVCVEKEVSGTRIPQVVCESEREKEYRTEDDRTEVERLQRYSIPN